MVREEVKKNQKKSEQEKVLSMQLNYLSRKKEEEEGDIFENEIGKIFLQTQFTDILSIKNNCGRVYFFIQTPD